MVTLNRLGIVRYMSLSVCAALLFALTGCDQKNEAGKPQYETTAAKSAKPIYYFAVHPLHNPSKLHEAYQPMIDYLNATIGSVHFELEASRDYQAYEAKFRKRTPEFLLPNPWQTLEAQKVGYRVIAMAGDPADFKGIIIVRKDAKIAQPRDLIGKVVTYPSPTALAACIMPQYFLHKNGISVAQDLQNRYVGSQESSIMNVYLGESAAGATWPPPWRAFQKDHPVEASQLKVMWETESLVNNSVMVRNDIPPELGEQVRKALLKLPESPDGKKILDAMQTARFYSANDADYNVVRQYIARFEKEVRPVEAK